MSKKNRFKYISDDSNVDVQSMSAINFESKMPPSAIEIEELVIGEILFNANSADKAIAELSPNIFYKETHKHIVESILELYKESAKIDSYTVADRLKKKLQIQEVGGLYQLVLMSNKASGAQIDFHIKILQQQSLKRSLQSICSQAIRNAFTDAVDVFDLYSETQQSIEDSLKGVLHYEISKVGDIHTKNIKESLAIQQAGGVSGVKSGLKEVDALTNGWQKADFIIIAGRPSMGKTAAAVTIATSPALSSNVPVAIFSLEMSNAQIVGRIESGLSGVNVSKIIKKQLTFDELNAMDTACKPLYNSPIYIDDTPNISLIELKSKARRLVKESGVKLIVIDYLQLMRSGMNINNREQEIAEISRGLKNLAKELDVPIIALSQLSRAVESRSDKKPQLSDLRESGCVTADTLITLENGEQITIKELFDTKSNLACPSLNKNLKIENSKITNVFYSGKKMVFELKTRIGKTIKASANHPFLKLEGWTRLDELKIGDRIATPREIKTCTRDTNPLTKDELAFHAHLLGNGSILKNQPYRYYTPDAECAAYMINAAKTLFKINSIIIDHDTWFSIRFPTPYRLTHRVLHPITNWFAKLKIQRARSYEKKISELVFLCDNNYVSHFISHLFSTDGSIRWDKNKKMVGISYSSTSRVMISQLQHLLLRFGIISNITHPKKVKNKKHNLCYNLVIYGSVNQIKFLEKIGCFGRRGFECQNMANHLKKINQNPNNDTIPSEVWDLFIQPYLTKNKILKQALRNVGVQNVGHSYSRERLSKVSKVCKKSSEIKNLCESDIYWDEITSIKKIGVEDVYDITVQKNHNFIANDIIIHNSLEQDADMVVFCYRPDYYGIPSYELGSESFDAKGLFMFIVAKHRNGELGEIPLLFLNEQTKIIDYNSRQEIQQSEDKKISAIAPNESFTKGSADEEVPF